MDCDLKCCIMLYQLLNQLSIGVWVKSFPSGKYIFVNDRFCEAVNTVREKLLGKTDVDLWGEEGGSEYQTHDQLVAEKREPVIIRGIIQHPDGHKTQFKKIKYPIIQNGEVVAVGGVARDLDGQNEFWTYLQETVEDLERVLREERT